MLPTRGALRTCLPPPSRVRCSDIPVEVACWPRWCRRSPGFSPYVARPIIGLRYRIEVRGLEAVKRKGRRGILFLPNHSSLLDPAFIVAHLYPAFQLRPLADEHQVNRTVFGYIALLYGSRILPNLERSGAGARDRTRARRCRRSPTA